MIDWLIDWEEENTIDLLKRKQLRTSSLVLVSGTFTDRFSQQNIFMYFRESFQVLFVVYLISKLELCSQVREIYHRDILLYSPSVMKCNQIYAPINLISDIGRVVH